VLGYVVPPPPEGFAIWDDCPDGGEVVHMDQLHSGLYLERESDLRRYKLAMNRLRAAALDPQQSRDLITNAGKDTT
jgi:hypothetical protein